ncbi:MAG: NADH-quinone oxidoreductase subunit K [Candidatus Omnitrophica bacterium]|nr:NADH-quinone oxidoreductase subunit K [Candidatus Omnitrophota bacterium]MDD5574699.1 NADH-quinone oxidoreductase subunit K [Candidatus Omnitrophota bacterium]
MPVESVSLFWTASAFVILMMIAGIYCILATFNLTRALIGIEILMKAVTLLLIVVGHVTQHTALAQALVITLIVIEVVVMVAAGGVVLSVFRKNKTIDVRRLRNLKG